MNFASRIPPWAGNARSVSRGGRTLAIVLLAVLLGGCGDSIRTPTEQEIQAFQEAGVVRAAVDLDRVEKAKLKTGPYRVVPGDVLEFTMPALLRAVTAAEVKASQDGPREDYPYLARVADDGTITLPGVGQIKVAGQTLAEIEIRTVEAYQDHSIRRPSVFVRISEYKTAKVYIAGAVEAPGVYTLRDDQMTLSYLLTEAGGITREQAGAAVVRIVRSDSPTSGAGSSLIVPVASANIPYRDMALEEGDTVVVEAVQMPMFSVLGLVNRPGNFDYPLEAEYTVAQAIAYAGGLEPVADPRYVMIYRLGENGSVVRLALQLKDEDAFTEALAMDIRPGDVVAVENTPRTRMNTLINNMVRINTGFYVYGRDIWNRD